MIPIKLHNTLTNQLETLSPIHPGEVRIYTCGPTVYAYAHIGNFRTFVFQDILRRFLRSQGLRLLHVMNVTDVDDRIIVNAAGAGISIREYTEKYIQAFLDDMAAINLEQPEILARATEHIDDMVALIEKLQNKGFTYKSDGSIYYRIAKFPKYGKLSRIDVSGMQSGARVDVDRYEKDDARDFALWKAPKAGEHFWETRIGPGRPGWHIECSAMAMEYLGETLDIHAGGVDLTFPHHENEIAQSESITRKPFARFWLHSEHLHIESQKMSKSLGNFYTLRDLLEMGYQPETIRYLLASVPYRKKLNFTFEGLRATAKTIERLRDFEVRVTSTRLPAGRNEEISERSREAIRQFEDALDDDLNTAEGLAAIFEYVRSMNIAVDENRFHEENRWDAARVLEVFDSIFDVLKPTDPDKLPAGAAPIVEPGISDSEIDQ